MGKTISKGAILFEEADVKHWDRDSVRAWMESQGFTKPKGTLFFDVFFFCILEGQHAQVSTDKYHDHYTHNYTHIHNYAQSINTYVYSYRLVL